MKRETFLIKYEGNEAKTHTWNSARRKVESIMRGIAKQDKTTYYRKNDQSVKDGFYFVRGCITWEGLNKRVIQFDIEKVQS